ncbi:MAG: hypothetical protein KGO96_10060 [Elusimicrobia bacterium]|nr:hypothetical protein [Elusimicrobiota bacterium]
MFSQAAVPLGFQQISSLSAAAGLTLPLGAQQAEGTSCSLSGKQLTVGGTVTGTFAVGQTVTGTGIPANTLISSQGQQSGTWLLSNACTTESGEAVTAYQTPRVDFVLLKAATENISWRDDGAAPTATVGMLMQTTDEPLLYSGDLLAIQFIQVSASAVLNASYYQNAG